VSRLDDLPRYHPKSRGALRAWLKQHHATAPGVWLVTYKKSAGKARVDYAEAVEELLCFGWIDGRGRPLDAERWMLLCTPRKPKSKWSALNKRRIKKLYAARKMARRGLEVVALAKRNGSWTALDEVEKLTVPRDLAAALGKHGRAREHFAAHPRSIQRAILEWIAQAKKAETRERRIAETARLAAKNLRPKQWSR
jgi:uncharacterized protein YdeI (YjbR/CyaY-like superfamily)